MAAGAVALIAIGSAPARAADLPPLKNGHNITVGEVFGPEKLGLSRTYEITMTDPNADGRVTFLGQLAVRVTLPEDYLTSSKTYPTLYLLHGHGGTEQQWTGAPGDAEKIAAGKGVILVSIEGGKAGWFTNWVDQSAGAQNWEKYHVDDLIPWIDENFRTKPDKAHRAIAGLSMGGYGALHYAFKHPNLFNHVSSYSGGVDLEDQAIRTAVTGSLVQEGLPALGAFGNPIWPFDTVWKSENPVRHADQLRGVGISLYAGDGLGTTDPVSAVIERGAGNATNTLAGRLTALGIPHYWEMYGHNVSYGGYTCDGGHNQGCWNMALAKDIGKIMADIS
ncbi:hypothetical protein VV02_11965 [Luteipulveratus mongoliensis]|uniref:Esterase n=1 Tax=Luteipulveratus mongoliensis TaxID=571913 RepID=A0A0K1JI64_9MICO|nr:hypothetical protein VV02_11965 [Luteipulveratus mongoliensis]